MRRILLCLLITTFTLTLPLFGSEDRYAGVKERMSRYIEELMAEKKMAGVTIALVDEDEVVWQRGFGYADVKGKIPADEQTVFRLASISKLFTGISIMQLVEKGLVDLDSPLSTYIPEFSINSRFEDAEPFTIRDMMTHQAGLPSDIKYRWKERFDEAYYQRSLTYEERVLDYLKDIHLTYRPGEISSYSNIGVDLLAIVVERVSGLTFADYVRQNIFEPLNMESSSFEEFFKRTDLGTRMALPHKKRAPGTNIGFPGKGAAALSSSASDMTAFIKMLLAKGLFEENRILKEESLQEMWTVQNGDSPLDGELKMGLSFYLNQTELDYAGRFYGHNGGFYHYFSTVKVLPEHGLGVVVLNNSSSGAGQSSYIAIEVLKEALKEKKGIEPPKTLDQPIALTPELTRKFTGVYSTAMMGNIAFKESKNGLKLELMGVNFKTEILENGWLRAVNGVGILQDLVFRVEVVEGKKRLYCRLYSFYVPVGEEYKPVEIPQQWLEKAGTYRIVEEDDSYRKGLKSNFRLTYKKGVLNLDTSTGDRLVLLPLNDKEALIAGEGRNARETVYFSEEDGETVMRWSGFKLVKR